MLPICLHSRSDFFAGCQSQDGRPGKYPSEASVEEQCLRKEHQYRGRNEYRKWRFETAKLRLGTGEASQGKHARHGIMCHPFAKATRSKMLTSSLQLHPLPLNSVQTSSCFLELRLVFGPWLTRSFTSTNQLNEINTPTKKKCKSLRLYKMAKLNNFRGNTNFLTTGPKCPQMSARWLTRHKLTRHSESSRSVWTFTGDKPIPTAYLFRLQIS